MNPCTDTFCTSSALPLKNPQSVANLKKAICVVRSDSIMGVMGLGKGYVEIMQIVSCLELMANVFIFIHNGGI